MEQDRIWDYFQNAGTDHGHLPAERQRFIAKRIKNSDVVLNIGVGRGHLERILSRRGVKVYSLDPSQRTIERLRSELKMGDRAQVGYGQALPFSEKMFDVVVLAEVLEHLDDATVSGVLAEVYRVLKPGATTLITTPYNENLAERVTVCPDCGKIFHRSGHVQSFSIERIEKIIKDHGFEIDKIYTSTFIDWRKRGVRSFIKSVIRYILARLGEQIADPHIILFARRPESLAEAP